MKELSTTTKKPSSLRLWRYVATKFDGSWKMKIVAVVHFQLKHASARSAAVRGNWRHYSQGLEWMSLQSWRQIVGKRRQEPLLMGLRCDYCMEMVSLVAADYELAQQSSRAAQSSLLPEQARKEESGKCYNVQSHARIEHSQFPSRSECAFDFNDDPSNRQRL